MEDENGLGYLLEVRWPSIADGYEIRKGEKSTKEVKRGRRKTRRELWEPKLKSEGETILNAAEK